MNILFITSNRVGDAVLSTGVLAHLVKTYPDARITIACGPYAADLFRAVPNLERLIILNKKRWNMHWFGLWNDCFSTMWDVIVDLRNSAVSRLLRYKDVYRHSKSTGKHKVVDNASVMYLTTPPSPHIWLNEKAEANARALLPTTRPLLALGPAANWPPKQWPIEMFTELAQRITAANGLLPDAAVVIIADARERAQLAPLLMAIPPEKRVEIIGQDLMTAAACLKQCQLFVGNDSGLMHLSAAVGTPTLGLFGPGYEEIYGPWGAHCAYVRTPESREVLLARLPDISAREPNLMQSLPVYDVYEAARKLLSTAAGRF